MTRSHKNYLSTIYRQSTEHIAQPVQLCSCAENFKTIYTMDNSVEKSLVDYTEAASILNCSRTKIVRLHLMGLLTPIPTTQPKYLFLKDQVLEIQKSLTSNNQVLCG